MSDDRERAIALATEAGEFFGRNYTRMHTIPWEDLSNLHLHALQYRFEQLRDSVPMLKKMADSAKVESIDSVDDVVPILFDHTTYKSYPSVLLDQGRFDQLTRWLNRLTSHDLSGIDASGCKNIDAWMDLLDRETPLRVGHTSGSTGTMSFLPRGAAEFDKFVRCAKIEVFQTFGSDEVASDEPLNVHVIYPFFRHGASAHVRSLEFWAKHFAGSEERMHTLYPGRISADVMHLAARIRAASANGTLDSIDISEDMRSRIEAFQQQQKEMPQRMERFVEEELQALAGQRVFATGPWTIHWDMAHAGFERGMSKMFSPDSVILTGGGNKGGGVPDNWREPIQEFFGSDRIHAMYGMSEVLGSNLLCEHEKYHVPPWIIPFVLDPDTSAPLPRRGKVTGRAAFYDLSVDALWGGFISGDEVTINWDADCACGRTSPCFDYQIQRYKDKNGDDKITCAATADAHEEALDFLNRFDQ